MLLQMYHLSIFYAKRQFPDMSNGYSDYYDYSVKIPTCTAEVKYSVH